MEAETKHYTEEEFSNAIAGFIGTEQWHPSGYGFTLTDGVQFLVTNGGRGDSTAYWLIDVVFSYQFEPAVKKERFQVYKFKRNGDGLDLVITDGNETVLGTQNIEYSDLRVDELTLWFVDGVLILPSEY